MKDMESRQPQKRHSSLSCVNVFIIGSGLESSLDFLCESESKSLIKVLNKPLLAYQLEFLEREGIKDVFILTNKKYAQGINDYISSQFIGEIKPEIITTNKENFDLLNVIKNKLTKSNFLLISGDSIIDFNLNAFIDNHILEHSLVSLILNEDTQKFSNQRFLYLPNAPIQVFGIDKKKNESLHRVVYSSQKDQSSPFTIKKSTLKHSPNFQLLYNYEDIHFYLFNANVFSVESEELNQMTSIKNDFIPFLISKANSAKLNTQLKDKVGENRLLTERIRVKCHIISKDEYAYCITSPSKLFNSIGEIHKDYADISDVLFQTKNNAKNYFANFSEAIQANVNNNKQFSEGIADAESISMESYIADPVNSIGKKCSVNKTIAGSNLTVSEGSKIINCLLFNGISIGKDCKVSNSLICDNVTIGDNCSIADCIIFVHSVIKPKSELNKMKVSKDDR